MPIEVRLHRLKTSGGVEFHQGHLAGRCLARYSGPEQVPANREDGNDNTGKPDTFPVHRLLWKSGHQFSDPLRKCENGDHNSRTHAKDNQAGRAAPIAASLTPIKLKQANGQKYHRNGNQPRAQRTQHDTQPERTDCARDPQRQTTSQCGKRGNSGGYRRGTFRDFHFCPPPALSASRIAARIHASGGTPAR